jgi:hypothetical protein
MEFGESAMIRRKYRLHHQSARVSQARNKRSRREGFTSVSVVFDPARGDVFLRNIGLTPNLLRTAWREPSIIHRHLTQELTILEAFSHRLTNTVMLL